VRFCACVAVIAAAERGCALPAGGIGREEAGAGAGGVLGMEGIDAIWASVTVGWPSYLGRISPERLPSVRARAYVSRARVRLALDRAQDGACQHIPVPIY